jgi:hypothetical protein
VNRKSHLHLEKLAANMAHNQKQASKQEILVR